MTKYTTEFRTLMVLYFVWHGSRYQFIWYKSATWQMHYFKLVID